MPVAVETRTTINLRPLSRREEIAEGLRQIVPDCDSLEIGELVRRIKRSTGWRKLPGVRLLPIRAWGRMSNAILVASLAFDPQIRSRFPGIDRQGYLVVLTKGGQFELDQLPRRVDRNANAGTRH